MQADVAMSGSISNDFAETNRVKQGCVLAPMCFSLYLSAMLEVFFEDSSEGVCLKTKKETNLFNVTHDFKSKTKTTTELVRDLQFAGHSASVVYHSDGIKALVNSFSHSAKDYCFRINMKKTESLDQPPKFRSGTSQPNHIAIK